LEKPRSAIVVVVDRLGSGFVGPYGNTWIDTPTLNRLASESLLYEHAIGDSYCLDTLYRSYWQGLHAAAPANASLPSLPAQVDAAGIEMILLTDSDGVANHPLARDFSAGTTLPQTAVPATAQTIDETRSGQLFAAAIDELAGRTSPYCLWLHADAMNGSWDAPFALRESMADEDDPSPPQFFEPPSYTLASDIDPDELLGLSQAFAGEVSALDRILDAFFEALANFPAARETLLIFTSPRGYPLGEHGAVGTAGDRLLGEVLQVPLLVRFPDQRLASRRCPSVVQPHDLCATLYDWFGLKTPNEHWGTSLCDPAEMGRGRCAVAVHDGESAVRTPIWHMRSTADAPPMLFAKPDDRWEANEVAGLCPDVVAELANGLNTFLAQAKSTALPCSPQLADDLVLEIV